MSTPVISAKTAQRLNDQVQSTIDPILFWTCNYEPTCSYAIAEDALFLTAVQDLYKFAIDTNCVFRGIAYNRRDCVCQDLLTDEEAKSLRAAFDTLCMLRTVMDHNQSERNGRVSTALTSSFSNWMKSVIGKEYPDSEEDFRRLNESLREIADELFLLSERCILLISQQDDINNIVDKWISKTIDWYCSNVRRDFYLGQLNDYYVARACAFNAHFDPGIDANSLYRRVRRWVQRQTTEKYNSKLRANKREREALQQQIEAISSSRNAVLREKYPDRFESALSDLHCELTRLDAEDEKNRSDLDAIIREHGTNLYDYYFQSKRLKDQLLETLDYLRCEGMVFTLLPQDFLYLDIEINFRGVWSPSNDFK